ncbi:hypothetical protein FHS78_000655 [Parvibaculum indicum]|uniref:hypothetical protein n=1 Tax=Parvibaculum indicum TaxID=562969 RepID=UPI001422118A|nr:hypothetical protein [Parvibaculum indicum]NIJ40385.1 hypothetical protein [Parvibaculum indicum]
MSTQARVDEDGHNPRSYRLGKGRALEATNDRLSEEFHLDVPPASHMCQIHPTKGFRETSRHRLENGNSVEGAMQMWAVVAARITDSSVGGVPVPVSRRKRNPMPHQGTRERARRRRRLGLEA